MRTSSILAAATAAGDSTGFSVDIVNPTTVIVNDLAGSETATLQITVDDGENWDNATYLDGTDIECTATVSNFLVIGPGEYRVAKSYTVAPVGVSIAQ